VTALAELEVLVHPRRAATLLEAHGMALWHLGRGDETMASYDRGLELLRDVDEPCAERALLLGAKAKTLMLWGRYGESIAVCELTLAEAAAAGSRAEEAHARNTMGVALACHGSVEAGIAQLQQAMDMDRADGRVHRLSRDYINLGDVLLLCGRARDALALLQAGIAEAEDRGKASWLRMQLTETAVALGEFDVAERELAEHRWRRETGATGAFYGAVAGELALWRGDDASALALLEGARVMVDSALDPQWHGPIAALLAYALLRHRRLDEARAVVEEVRLRLARTPGMQDHARLARLAATAVSIEAAVAQRGRDLGDDAMVVDAVERAEAALEGARAEAGVPTAAGWIADAEAELTRARGVPTPEAWARSREMWLAMERFPLATQALWCEAEDRLRLGEREAAGALLAQALAESRAMGMHATTQLILVLGRRARLVLEPDGDAAACEEEPGVEFGLTPREQEVLALVAAGATNREIGEALFMAEKTASVHVSRILAKLDVRSRTEAAAVAHRLGLVSGAPAR
jgi:DNA-binding CsgD family transcriptional regulator/tetratricopeptide (TPR) repeat protein